MKKIIRITERDLTRIVKRVLRESNGGKMMADFNEGVIISTGSNDCEDSFSPSCMKNKTINLYDDSSKSVWDQTWYVVNFTQQNYGKQVVFTLNKDLDKTGTPKSPETGTMIYNCMSPNQFTVNYKGTTPEVTNETRFNNVTDKLKEFYCPSVLGVQSGNADFASTGGKSSADMS